MTGGGDITPQGHAHLRLLRGWGWGGMDEVVFILFVFFVLISLFPVSECMSM